MSTLILNASQSSYLGMHQIEECPIVSAGKSELRPMMHFTLSYDYRNVDGKEAATLLVQIKEAPESPERTLHRQSTLCGTSRSS